MTFRAGVAGLFLEGMPRELATRLNAEINKALAVPEVRSRMDAMGVELVNSTPEQLAVAKADRRRLPREST